MKKTIPSLILLLAASLLPSCNTQKEKTEDKARTEATIDSLRQALTQSQNESGDLIETLAQIQQGFSQINEAEGIVTVENNQGEQGNGQRIKENLTLIENKLKLNRELIANLKQQLRTSTQRSEESRLKLEQMVEDFTRQLEEKQAEIAKLQAEIAERDKTIAAQGEQITSLHEDVSQLAQKNTEKSQTIAEQDKQMHTAYYVFGTKKELREQHIISRGDVLRSGTFNKDYFTTIDLRVTKTVKLYSKSAKLATSHPAGSYTLDKDAQGQYILHITKPEAFWSVSRYLVIIVK